MKKFLAFALVLGLVTVLMSISAFAVTGKIGDTDCNGSITAEDITKLACHLDKKASLTDQGLKNADLNADNAVNSADLTALARKVAKIGTGGGDIDLPIIPIG